VRLACAPAVAAKWQEAVELARRTAGAQRPVWACAEWIAAEVTSALPPEGAAGAEASGAGAVAARDLGKEGRGADCAPHERQPPAPTDREPGLRHWAFPHVRWAAPRVGAPSPGAEGEPGSDLAAVAERRERGGRHEPDGPTEERASHAHPELAWLALAERTTLRRLEREAGAEPRRAVAFHAPPEVAASFRETLERVRRLLARRPAEGAASHRGRAPDHLLFELGVRPDGPPLARYRSGDVLVEGPA